MTETQRTWIPTFVGMTGEVFVVSEKVGEVAVFPINARNLKSRHSPKTKNQKQKFRHSRAGGNLVLSVRKLIGKNGFFRFYVLDSRFRGNDAEKLL
ncbi:hypothetical protein [Neisseria meningitidis]|uniref:hypothetical protein n=1 Tax=Neisseria meningitidis TaxID=487 RepID=UPI001E2EFC7A|nr:hypothetical protein [Neisseria meningitidis]